MRWRRELGGEGDCRPVRCKEWRGMGVEADGRQTFIVVESCIQLPAAQGTLVLYFQFPASIQTITLLPLAPYSLPSSNLNDILSPTSFCYPPSAETVPHHLLHAYRTSCPEAPSSLSPPHHQPGLNHPLLEGTFIPILSSLLVIHHLPICCHLKTSNPRYLLSHSVPTLSFFPSLTGTCTFCPTIAHRRPPPPTSVCPHPTTSHCCLAGVVRAGEDEFRSWQWVTKQNKREKKERECERRTCCIFIPLLLLVSRKKVVI